MHIFEHVHRCKIALMDERIVDVVRCARAREADIAKTSPSATATY